MQDLAENTPELFLKVLDFTENKDIVLLHFVNLAKHVKWDVLLRNKFPQDFESKDDIKAKVEWLSEYEPKDIDAIVNMFLRSKKKNEKDNGKRRDYEEEIDRDELEFQSMALKCFNYWAKGWSKALRGHTDWVYSVIKLNKSTIVSASHDRTLRVWNLTNDTSRVLQGHTRAVSSVIKLNRPRFQCKWGSYVAGVDLTNDTSRVLEGHTRSIR